MAKKNLVEPCIFCDELECRCGKPPKKVGSKPSVKRAAKPVEAAKPHFRTEVEQDEDLNMRSALRVLRDIVCTEDQKEIDSIINRPLPLEVDKRVSEWRRKHVR